jgi:tetratricopeptide (TPR) repeat protein
MNRKELQKSPELEKLIHFYEKQDNYDCLSVLKPEQFISLTDYYSQRRHKEEALNVCNYALSMYPYNMELVIRQAKLYFHFMDYDKAIDLLEKAELIAPDNKQVQYLLAKLYHETGDAEAAIEHIQQAIDMDDTEASELFLLKALIHMDHEEYEEALKVLQVLLSKNPNNSEALFEFAQCCRELGQEKECILFFEKLIDKDPYAFETWNNLGIIYGLYNLHEKAIEAFDMAATINNENTEALYNMGNSYMETENYDKAIEIFNQCMEAGRNDYMIHLQTGLAYAYFDQYEKARYYFRKSIELHYQFPDSWFALGMTYENEGDSFKAIPYLKQSLKIDRYNEIHWYELGNCYAKAGYTEKAKKAYKEALQLNPFFTDAWLELIITVYEYIGYDEALQIISEANSIIPDNPELQCIISGIYINKGLTQKGMHYLEMSLKQDATMGELLLELFPYLSANHKVTQIINKYDPEQRIL